MDVERAAANCRRTASRTGATKLLQLARHPVGVDYWWFGCFVDVRMHDRVRPHFAAAAANTALSEQAKRAIAAWRARPSDFEQEAFITRPEVADQANAFIRAFNLIRMRFKEFIGKSVFHCHILPHEDTGMMQNFLIKRRDQPLPSAIFDPPMQPRLRPLLKTVAHHM